jgi:phage FluMu protein Com
MAYTIAKHNSKLNEYRCGVQSCNKLLFTGEVIEGRVEKKCQCGVINIVEVPVRKFGSYQDNLNLVKKNR